MTPLTSWIPLHATPPDRRPTLRILALVESDVEAAGVREALTALADDLAILPIRDLGALRDELSSSPFDLIVVRRGAAGCAPEAALRAAREAAPLVPLIFVSPDLDSAAAAKLIELGADDVAFDALPALLPRAAARALREAEDRRGAEEALRDRRRADALSERILDSLNGHAVIVAGIDGFIREWNNAASLMLATCAKRPSEPASR